MGMRAFDTQLNAVYKRRPRFVAIRQTKLTIDARDAIYGTKARPFGRKLRLTWTRLVAWYVRCRALRYSEVLEVAQSVNDDLRTRVEDFPHEDPVSDTRVRWIFSVALTEAARRKRRQGFRRDWTDRDVHFARVVAKHKQLGFDGYCPLCVEPLPCAECGTFGIEIDGKGGLRTVSGS
jgi:hypothetical protein